jgi:hypothetical protein
MQIKKDILLDFETTKENQNRIFTIVMFMHWLIVLLWAILLYKGIRNTIEYDANSNWDLLIFFVIALLLPLMAQFLFIKKKRAGWVLMSFLAILLCIFFGKVQYVVFTSNNPVSISIEIVIGRMLFVCYACLAVLMHIRSLIRYFKINNYTLFINLFVALFCAITLIYFAR